MDCSRVTERLSFYLDGVLDEHTLELVEAHLSICPHCRQELAFLKIMVEAAGEIESINPPAGLRTRIATAIREEAVPVGLLPRITRWTAAWSRPVWIGVGSTAAACAAVAAILIALHPVQQPIAMKPSSHQSTPTAVVAKASQAPGNGTELVSQPPAARRVSAGRHDRIAFKTRPAVKRVKTVIAAAPKIKTTLPRRPAVLPSLPGPAAQADEVTAAIPETRPLETVPASEDAGVTSRSNKSQQVAVAVAPTMLVECGDDVMKQIKAEASMRRGQSGMPSVALFSSRF